MRPLFRSTLVAAAVAALNVTAQAQIDQFDVRREGDDAVLLLRFGSEIQFQRSVTTRSGELTLVFYTLINTTNAKVRATQGMRLGAAQGLPAMTVSDETDVGERFRRLVLRTGASTRIEARAGQGNRSLEIVLPGAGAAVSAVQTAAARRAERTAVTGAPATMPAAERRFAIVLQSSSDPNLEVSTRLPRSLQDYEVFTRERVVDGVKRYELLVGHFSNRTQAEALLRQLSSFTQAEIVAIGEPVAAPAIAAVTPQPAPRAVAAPDTPPPVSAAVAPPPAPATPPVPTQPTAPASAAAPAPAAATAAEMQARADALWAAAQTATQQGNLPAAIEALNELLNLPPNARTQEAQELVGMLRLRSGDPVRARFEFDTYLQLYPQGAGSDRVRRELAALPALTVAAPVSAAKLPGETTLTGSVSMTYFGGNGQLRSQEFKDSPVAGLPQVAGDPLLAADKSNQLFNDVDLTWRRRDADSDMRFVFRDSYTTDLDGSDKNRNRLSALYVDYKSLADGYAVRLGRQSPTGGGVMGRFDGVSGNLLLRPKMKLSAVAGRPTDKFFESRRRFYGLAFDADGMLPNFGAGVYAIQQTIDSEIDRRGTGLEMRYFKGGASVFAQFDYDALIKGLNIATVQGTFITEDMTVFNALYDKRSLQMLALGNSLTFEDPANPGVLYTRIADKLATTTLLALREQIKRITPFITQGQVGVTTPINKTWQVGASAQLTSTGAIPPVPEVVGFELGRPATGNIYSASAQLIGLNLYSARDTHVFAGTAIHSPTLQGLLFAYNNSSLVGEVWQVEPSLQFYRDRTPQGSTSQRWTPGMRVTYRGVKGLSLESSLTYEIGTRVATDINDPTVTITTRESSNRANYSLGARYEF